MEKERLYSVLSLIALTLTEVSPSWCIFGSCALWIAGEQDEMPHDIDILMSRADAEQLRAVWHRMQKAPAKESARFRSLHLVYKIEGVGIDVSGDLEVKGEDGAWRRVEVKRIEESHGWKYASLEDCISIMRLFGREKDLRKLKRLEQKNP